MISEELENKLILYVNGNLPDNERSDIDTLKESNLELRDEIRYLNNLRDGIKSQAVLTPGEMGLARLRRSISEKHAPEKPAPVTSSWWRPLAIAASLVVIIQAVLILNPIPEETIYSPLSGTTGSTLQITFSPTATEVQIRQTLQAVEATLVDGPGAAGIYRIRLNVEVDSPEYEQLIQKLRSHSDIITHVAAE
jgi:hypothetical protein